MIREGMLVEYEDIRYQVYSVHNNTVVIGRPDRIEGYTSSKLFTWPEAAGELDIVDTGDLCADEVYDLLLSENETRQQ